MGAKYEDRCIAFLDVLGMERIVERSRLEPEAFLKPASTIAEIVSEAKAISIREEDTRSGRGLRASWFSDTLVVTGPGSTGLRPVLEVAHHLYGRLLQHKGMLLRGAVTRGPLYDEGGVLVGPALIDAYRLESTKAKFPRIIVTDEALADETPDMLVTGASRSRRFTIREDEDGLQYVDPLRTFSTWTGEGVPGYVTPDEWVKCFRERAADGIKEFASDPHTREKYEWMQRKVDEFERAGGVDQPS